MVDYIIGGCIIVMVLIGLIVVCGMMIAFFCDLFSPPKPSDIRKVWVEVEPDRFLEKKIHMKSTAYGVGVYTHVYMYKKTGEIYGTVTPMKNGLWNAMMYNGRQNVFYTDKLAKEWVENYKPHIVK